MIHLPIPVLSPTSGSLSDGVVVGRVNQSLLTGAFSNAQIAGSVFAYRMDKDVGTFTNVSTAIISGNTNAVEPFGAQAAMSVGDGLLIACDTDTEELFFNITRAGVGTWNGIEIRDSTDGSTFNRILTGHTDTSNGFKNSGWHRITVPNPTPARVSFSPSPVLEITSRRWILITLKDFVSVTTAPAVAKAEIKHHAEAVRWNDFTAITNATLTDGNFSTSPATIFYVDGSIRYYVFPFLAYGLDLVMHRRAADVGTWEDEYLATDDTWKALPDFSDPSNDEENGPATLGDPTQEFRVRWTVPTDWTQKTLSLTLISGATQSVTGYFIRKRLPTVTSLGPVAPPLARRRVRAFGNANTTGMEFLTATTVKGVVIKNVGSQSAAVTLQVFNMTTGVGRAVTIPTSPTLPLLVDFTDIVFEPGERVGVAYVSGGTLTSVDLYLLT